MSFNILLIRPYRTIWNNYLFNETSHHIKRLALELNISTSTVSRAEKDNPEISTLTRARIKKLAKELNYEPKALTLSLRHSKTKE